MYHSAAIASATQVAVATPCTNNHGRYATPRSPSPGLTHATRPTAHCSVDVKCRSCPTATTWHMQAVVPKAEPGLEHQVHVAGLRWLLSRVHGGACDESHGPAAAAAN